MQTKRVTVSLPAETYYLLTQNTGERETSRFVAEAIEEKLLKIPREASSVEEFLNLRRSLPKVGLTRIKQAISRGRK